MIDQEGYRPNVGIILANNKGQVLWAKRCGQDAWQFPQGGIDRDETPEDAMYRELHEEVGLQPGEVDLVSQTQGWLRYKLPENLVRKNNDERTCIGQKQKWFLLHMMANDSEVCFDCGDKPEFDEWKWVSYWYPMTQIIDFKQDVYRKALLELSVKHSGMVHLD